MEKTIMDQLRFVRKRSWQIILFVIIACTTTFYVSKNYTEPIYSASGQMIVNQMGATLDNNNLNDLTVSLNLIQSYRGILESPRIMNQVVQNHPEFGLTAAELADKLNIGASDKSQIIKLTVEDGNYERAAGIVNAVSQTFIRNVPLIMNLDNVQVLSPADPAMVPEPINSSMAMNLVLSFAVALMAAVGLVLILENTNPTLRTEQEAEMDIGLPIIAVIPVIPRKEMGKKSSTLTRKLGESPYVAPQ